MNTPNNKEGTALKKGTVVELENEKQGKQPFSPEEAAILLQMPQNTGLWVLPQDSKFQLHDGKIIRTGSTKQNPGS